MHRGGWRTRRLLGLLLLAGGAGAPLCTAGEYRTVDVESLKIVFDSDWGSRTTPGYVPVRFDITNLGEARVLEIVGEGTRFFRTYRMTGPPGAMHVLQAVRLARGDRVRLTVPVPVFADSENLRFEIQEDGRTIERFNYAGFQSGTPPADASALIVADPATPFGKLAAGWPRPAAGTARMPTFAARTSGALDFVLEPARLPTNWLGYTSLRAVIMGPAEWEQLTEPQKSALLTWTACGGDLIVADGNAVAVAGGQLRPAAAADTAARGYFFGRIHTPASASIAASGLASVLTAADRVADANWSLPANRAGDWGKIAERGFRLPIPGVTGVPARAYLSILLVFSLLIGPVNYWFLWRRKQQVLFVLTAPLISVLFIVLLAGYVLAGEGLAVSGRAVTFTMLDQVRRQAVTRASASFYAAGMTPGGGLRFGRDVAVYPIGPDGTGSRDPQTVDLTEMQRFSSGVIQARAPANVEEIAFRSARERLSFDRDGGGISVVNGLDVPVSRLLYRSGGTVYSLAAPLPAGGRAVLTPGPEAAATFVPADLPQSARFFHLVTHQPEGSYLAVLERSPFWEAGMPRVIERGSFHFVIGWPEGQP